MDFTIRRAQISDSSSLTDISFAAKRVWNYPEQYYDIWKDELTITPVYIAENRVYLAEANGAVLGYFSIVEVREDFWAGKVFVKKGFWLEHIFINPIYIGQGIGTCLMAYASTLCLQENILLLHVFSDPNANGFYDRLGATYIGESPSSIEGRTVSVYELTFIRKGTPSLR